MIVEEGGEGPDGVAGGWGLDFQDLGAAAAEEPCTERPCDAIA